jgi:CRISPR-associated protein (TIGR03985 family)
LFEIDVIASHIFGEEFKWYNYRLDRIQDLQPKSWEADKLTQSLQAEIQEKEQIKPEYTPEHIQKQLESAYGFDFYNESATMLLRFNRDFSQRHIQGTNRHNTFKQQKKVIEFVREHLKLETDLTTQQKQSLFNKIQNSLNDYDYYSLEYRVGDNNVIMRLRAWCPNVEVILPWNLRQRMKEDIEKTWRLYESD